MIKREEIISNTFQSSDKGSWPIEENMKEFKLNGKSSSNTGSQLGRQRGSAPSAREHRALEVPCGQQGS